MFLNLDNTLLDSIMKMLNIPKLAPIRLRRNCHILFLPYSVLFLPLTPAYFKDRSHNRVWQSAQNLCLAMPSHISSFYDKSYISVYLFMDWTALLYKSSSFRSYFEPTSNRRWFYVPLFVFLIFDVFMCSDFSANCGVISKILFFKSIILSALRRSKMFNTQITNDFNKLKS